MFAIFPKIRDLIDLFTFLCLICRLVYGLKAEEVRRAEKFPAFPAFFGFFGFFGFFRLFSFIIHCHIFSGVYLFYSWCISGVFPVFSCFIADSSLYIPSL